MHHPSYPPGLGHHARGAAQPVDVAQPLHTPDGSNVSAAAALVDSSVDVLAAAQPLVALGGSGVSAAASLADSSADALAAAQSLVALGGSGVSAAASLADSSAAVLAAAKPLVALGGSGVSAAASLADSSADTLAAAQSLVALGGSGALAVEMAVTVRPTRSVTTCEGVAGAPTRCRHGTDGVDCGDAGARPKRRNTIAVTRAEKRTGQLPCKSPVVTSMSAQGSVSGRRRCRRTYHFFI